VVSSTGDTIPIEVERDGERLKFETGYTREETKFWERKSLRKIEVAPKKTPLVGKVEPNSPAARAGIEANDILLEVDGVKLYAPEALGDYLERKGEGHEVRLKVQRTAKVWEVSLRPEKPVYPPDFPAEEQRPLIGVIWERTGLWAVDHPGPMEQVVSSVNSMVSTFGALFSPKSDVKAQHLSGFVGIMRIYYVLFESEHGWRHAIWFSVILNVNLALLNLLPIPVLDGGHILLAVIESIRRKPVAARSLYLIQNACALLLIGYMVYLTFFDVQDLPWKRQKTYEIKFAPKTEVVPARP
jgi:regulator of sigma E protease